MARESAAESDLVSRRNFVLTGGALGAAMVAGCTESADGDGGDGSGSGGSGGNGGGDGDGNGDGNGGDSLSGNIRISGSSTVYPVATAVSELFKEDHSEVTFDISRDGSSGGFENVFIPGNSDINNSSRPITEEEVQRCQDNGFEPVEFMIAQDALTIVVNNNNDWVDSMSLETLEAIWTPDSPPETWADVNSDWPDQPFELFGAASTSGTFDYFTETVLGEVGRIRDDYTGTEEDNQIAAGVQGSNSALGFLPFAYYVNNPDSVKALSLSTDGGEAVEPSLEGAASGNYPLARPLFFYANSNKLESKNHLQEFVRFYINQSTDQQLIANQIGYVPSSDEQAQENIDTLEQYV